MGHARPRDAPLGASRQRATGAARQRAPARDRLDQRKLARAAAALMSFALFLLPARSADRKKSLLPFGRRGGVESGLLNAPRLLSRERSDR